MIYFSKQSKIKSLIKKAPSDILKSYFESLLELTNHGIQQNTDLVAVDFETTGLNFKKDTLLSIGSLPISNFEIQLDSAQHILIKSAKGLSPDNVIIHKITDDQLEVGVDLESALNILIKTLTGKVLVAHHAVIEANFLNKACLAVYGCGIMVPVVDTLAIEAKYLPKSEHQNGLTLSQCSLRYNLPQYNMHDALSDALSCAELLLAQCAYHEDFSLLEKHINYLP